MSEVSLSKVTLYLRKNYDMNILNGSNKIGFTDCLKLCVSYVIELCSKKYIASLYTKDFEKVSHSYMIKICTIHVKS